MRILVVTIIFSILGNSFGFWGNEGIRVYAKQKEFRQLRSKHFIISYKENVGRAYVTKVKNIAEKYYRVIAQDFNFYRDKFWIWENRAKIFIANDKDDYLNSFNCSPWSAACVNLHGKIIYTYPDQQKFASILVHELTHIIFREHIGESRLSLWLDEGVATYMEDKYGSGNYKKGLQFLKKKINEDTYIKFFQLSKVTIANLDKENTDYVNLFYLESFSIINFIMKKYGKYKFSNFLRLLKKGEGIESALSKVFYDFKNLDKLEAEWKDYYLK